MFALRAAVARVRPNNVLCDRHGNLDGRTRKHTENCRIVLLTRTAVTRCSQLHLFFDQFVTGKDECI